MPAWMPTAARVLAYRDAGPMADARRVLWIASGLDATEYSAALAASYANASVLAPHVILDARTDELIQMLPADRRAMHVKSDGIQVLVLAPECLFPLKGRAVDGLSAVRRVMGWVRDLDVPDFSPRGPAIEGHPKEAGSKAGHYSSEGKIDVSRLVRA